MCSSSFISPTTLLPLRHHHPIHPYPSISPLHPPPSPSRPRRHRHWSPPITAASASSFPDGHDDPYEILAVARDADASAVKRAYRRAALQNHPDVSQAPDAADRFRRVQEAYALLSDPSARAAYDRRARVAQQVDTYAARNRDGGAAPTPDMPDFARQWRARNPMPNDLDDSLSSIFTDIFSGVKGAVGKSGGLMDDFVEFLEKQVDGFSVGADGYASTDDDDDDANNDDADSLRDVLRSADPDVLQAEAEDARFVLAQLRVRKARLNDDAAALRARERDWADRARRGGDAGVREAAREREKELAAEAKRLQLRARKTQSLVDKGERRLAKIESRLADVRKEEEEEEEGAAAAARQDEVQEEGNRGKAAQKKAVDEELERMKRELGL